MDIPITIIMMIIGALIFGMAFLYVRTYLIFRLMESNRRRYIKIAFGIDFSLFMIIFGLIWLRG
jgi:hypothetical protein